MKKYYKLDTSKKRQKKKSSNFYSFRKDKEKGKGDDGEASDRSPSPPNKGGRRVKIKSSSLGAEEELDAAKFGFTEEELQRVSFCY